MKKHILFIHSAGSQAPHQGSDDFASYLQKTLGRDYEIQCPLMPAAENPHYVLWKDAIKNQLDAITGEIILVGHSLGGSVLLKYLSEERGEWNIAGLFIVAAPYWGAEGWQVNEFMLPENIVMTLPVYFYQSCDDEVVPFSHLDRYAQLLPNAKIHAVENHGHEFKNGLPDIVFDIRSLVH